MYNVYSLKSYESKEKWLHSHGDRIKLKYTTADDFGPDFET